MFCIGGTDPTTYISSVVALQDSQTALYVRGDDMPTFPSRTFVETVMPICLLPYTTGVSSTALRKLKYSHIRRDEDINKEIFT